MKAIFGLLLILAGVSAVSAQERDIQKAEFEAVVKNAVAILDAKPHRITVTSNTNVNDKPQEAESAKTIVEVASKDKRRSIREFKSIKQNSKRELVRFGNKTYLRENDGQWKQDAAQNNAMNGNIKISSEQSDYKSLGKDTLNNQNVTIYQRIRNRVMTDSINNEEIQSSETVKYWIDDKGALLKREMVRENRRSGKVFNINVSATFDYDQNIQVVAPQIAGN